MKKYWINLSELSEFNEFTYGKKKETDEKYFMRHKSDWKVRPLIIEFQQMIGFLNKWERTHYISFVINDQELLEIYELIRNRISEIIGNEFDKQVAYDLKHVKFLKKVLKFCNGKINTYFYDKKLPK